MDDYKVAIIFGKDNPDNNTFDGQVIRDGNAKSDDLHSQTLIDIGLNYYPNQGIFKRFNPRHQAQLPAYVLTELGNIVFMNMTKYTEESLSRYGRNGMFMMPREITPKQAEALKEMVGELTMFDNVINSELTYDGVFVDGHMAYGQKGITPDELYAKIIAKVVIKNERVR